MTSPVELPLYGKLKITETSKESLLELWETIITKTGVQIQTNERVLHIEKDSESFYVQTVKGQYAGQFVVLGIGRRGTPRKLGVPGEQLSKVTYRLIEAETYQNSQVLVVGGGDSAVEAAVALASQGTNRVTLSYRKGEFSRIKERNFRHLEQEEKSGRLNVMFHSSVREIREDSIVLEAGPKVQEIPNDYVFVFAGGEMPFDFLKKIGIELQSQALS